MATHTAMTQGNDPQLRAFLEQKVGILHFVSPKEHGWHGVLRKRFTDFQVHEIDENNNVVHLNDYYSNIREYERALASKDGKTDGTLSSSPASQNHDASATSNPKPNTQSDHIAQRPEAVEPSSCQVTENARNDAKADDVVLSSVDVDGSHKNLASQNDSPDHISDVDVEKLKELLGDVIAGEVIDLYKRILADPKARPQNHGVVKFPRIEDKSARMAVHSEIRRIFSSRIETETNSEGIIQAKAQPSQGNSQRGNRSNNRDRGNKSSQVKIGKFLHFSLYKENKDTMEAINILGGALGMRPNFFSTAGTKDRRAVTVQRVSIRGRDPKRVLTANAKLRGLAVGDFKFSEKDLYLGCHSGNEFTIVLKDCTFQDVEKEPFQKQLEVARSTLARALTDITQHGFINYFGTQRFGTHEIGTQVLGMKILQGDLKGAVHDLLSFDTDLAAADPETLRNDNNRLTDMYRAKALAKYRENGDAEAAVKLLPKRCNTELAILKHLNKQPTDFHGAILAITRNMRNMYLHAYQSLVWNFVASKRWELFGSSVVKGDLVFDTVAKSGRNDDDDEENIHLVGGSDTGEALRQTVRTLTAEDVSSGHYSIADVILSIPGTDVVYPDNEIGEFYKEFMTKEENGGLDPHNMHRSQKQFSLTGDYRKFMGTFIGTPTGSVHTYTHDNDQLVPTDLDLIRARQDKICTATQRRKADELEDPSTEIRINDAWAPGSTNGSNKRVKVDTNSTEFGSEHGEDLTMNMREFEVPKLPCAVPEAAAIQGFRPDATNEIIIREMSSMPPQSHVSIQSGIPQTSADATNEQAPEDASPHKPLTDAITKDAPIKPQPQASETLSVAEHSVRQNESSLEAGDQKIAVILKFSLASSSYATMVLRELQG